MFILPPETADRERIAESLRTFVLAALPGKRLKVTVEVAKKRRSDDQNRALWGVAYKTLADEATREARKICKPHFERLWQSGGMDRTEAYAWLASKLGLTPALCHWGLFDIRTCHRARDLCAGMMGAIRG
ncbi:hypothetical protein ISN76_13165 [Dyella halodurans]|uniref:Zinc-finger-containing protein n=1 Tax=Dyella halodurans TaxID=1920171 RepID=A0ABV9C0V9_9GAMM|nr:zinc-finger-containing protein [Dyella halodurans]